MIKHLQRMKDPVILKLQQSELDPILMNNAYHSPEESEEEPDNSTNHIVVRDLKWRSECVSINISKMFVYVINCIYTNIIICILVEKIPKRIC